MHYSFFGGHGCYLVDMLIQLHADLIEGYLGLQVSAIPLLTLVAISAEQANVIIAVSPLLRCFQE